jgi:hypothetical protein
VTSLAVALRAVAWTAAMRSALGVVADLGKGALRELDGEVYAAAGSPRTHKVHPSSTGHDKKPQLTTPGMR